ncbi:MAG: Mur ligase family protein, partial [Acidimicrobiales bacterium]
AGLIGTLSGARTTPESPDLQSQLVAMLEAARDAAVPGAVAMEITSHALVQHRPDGYLHDLAVFTNLSQDHLDYHGTMEAYYQAKRILFTKQHARRGVVNADDEHGRRLLEESEIPVEAFSMEDVEDVRTSGEGSSFRLFGEEVRLPLLGALNIRNAVAAAASARALWIDVTTIGEGLRQVGQVPGRLEKVGNALGLTAVVDYAHTPAGLVEVCRTLRDLLPTGGRLVVVFGAGGDRDREKRPLMGDAVSKGADLAVLTSDNPRHEDPLTIIDEVKAGWKSAGELHVEVDRRRAILLALELAERADVVLVAGKGHETTQQVGDEFIALDDRKVIVEEAERLAGAA